jgi:hypothetical protein
MLIRRIGARCPAMMRLFPFYGLQLALARILRFVHVIKVIIF